MQATLVVTPTITLPDEGSFCNDIFWEIGLGAIAGFIPEVGGIVANTLGIITASWYDPFLPMSWPIE
jgi:hypothetical protein